MEAATVQERETTQVDRDVNGGKVFGSKVTIGASS
jgi:hypothetical protein